MMCVLLVHISNRFIELEPVLSAIARKRGLAAAIRDDNPQADTEFTPSSWVVITRDKARLAEIARLAPTMPLRDLLPPAKSVWTDDHASILPYVRWEYLLRRPS